MTKVRFNVMDQMMTLDQIVARLNANDSYVRWFKVDESTISYEALGPGPVGWMGTDAAGNVDDNDKDEPEDEPEKTEYRSCLRCGRRIEMNVDDSHVFQYCGYCLSHISIRRRLDEALERQKELEERIEEAESFIDKLVDTFTGVTDNHEDPSRFHSWEWIVENWEAVPIDEDMLPTMEDDDGR